MTPSSRILIVTPTLNSETFLEETILSVATQRGDLVIHYHVQDGLSTDGTLDILRKWERIFAEGSSFLGGARVVFSWSSEKDRSMYDSLNKGFARLISDLPPSKTVLMTWINSDDRLAAGSFQTAISAHKETGFEAITGLASVMIDSGVKAWNLPYHPVARENIRKGLHDGRSLRFIMQEGTYWTLALWHKCGGLDASLKLAGDWDLWRRLAEHADWLGLNVVLAHHRRHASQLSNSLDRYWEELDQVAAAAGLGNCSPNPAATGNKGWIDIVTNRWEIQKQAAGIYSTKDKEKAALGWEVKFSELGYPIERIIGLSHTEHWGRWSDANLYDRVIITLSLVLPASLELSFMAAGYCGREKFTEVGVLVGGQEKIVRLTSTPELHTVVFNDVMPSPFITFIPKNPVSPSTIKPGGDSRKLGIGLRTLKFRAIGSSH
jgi:Glycosyl transferase family 2